MYLKLIKGGIIVNAIDCCVLGYMLMLMWMFTVTKEDRLKVGRGEFGRYEGITKLMGG